LDICDNSY